MDLQFKNPATEAIFKAQTLVKLVFEKVATLEQLDLEATMIMIDEQLEIAKAHIEGDRENPFREKTV